MSEQIPMNNEAFVRSNGDAQHRLAAVEALCTAAFVAESGLEPKDVIAAVHAVCTRPKEGPDRHPIGLLAAVASARKRNNMPDFLTCGHPVACAVHTREGGNYCGWCEDVAQLRAEVVKLRNCLRFAALASGEVTGLRDAEEQGEAK